VKPRNKNKYETINLVEIMGLYYHRGRQRFLKQNINALKVIEKMIH
jgi:hypothetical protein